VADQEKPAAVDREQALSLIGKYARQFAMLATEQGCTTLAYMLQFAAEQAERN
jgi:hypothetical protein